MKERTRPPSRVGYFLLLLVPMISQMFIVRNADTIIKGITETADLDEGPTIAFWSSLAGKRLNSNAGGFFSTKETATALNNTSKTLIRNHLWSSDTSDASATDMFVGKGKFIAHASNSSKVRQEIIQPAPRYENDKVDPFYYEETLGFKDDAPNIWDDQPNLPRWMKAYFRWHRYRRGQLKEQETELFKNFTDQQWNTFRSLSNITINRYANNHVAYEQLYQSLYDSNRFLVMQCVDGLDNKCGGTSDRLKPLPAVLRIAYESKRVLLVFWTRPYRLEEFLMPPQGGVDWRMPIWLEQILRTNGRRGIQVGGIRQVQQYSNSSDPFLRSTLQIWDGGRGLYDAQVNATPSYSKEYNPSIHKHRQPSFDDIYYLVWKMFYTPSPPIRKIVIDEMQRLELVPGKYIGVHLRALYGVNDRPKPQLQVLGENAVNCASLLAPGQPMFFASDSPKALSFAQDHIKRMTKDSSVKRFSWRSPVPDPPLHMDFGSPERPASDYYDTFVDLYLLSLGGCGSFNIGGYGQWAILIGGHLQCSARQAKMKAGKISNFCSWTEGVPETPAVESTSFDYNSILRPPMPSTPLVDQRAYLPERKR